MKIVFQHYRPLPVFGYGGTERILFWHMQELARLGHDVYFIGPKTSTVEKYGIHLIAHDENKVEIWSKLIPQDSDIIHLSYNYQVPGKIPTINTVHGNGQPGEQLLENSVFVSKKHAQIHGSNVFVHNALNFDEYPFTPKKLNGTQFLFLAKASWKVKNLSDCVSACRSAHKHLHIAGGRWWGLSRFVHSHGMVGDQKKLQLMHACDALLFPVRWHEPFGIAVIEAMSQGLPTIGSPYGSLPELISSEVGVIVQNKSELNQIIQHFPNHFDSQYIRQYAEKNFSIAQYTLKYLELYQQVIEGKKLNPQRPCLIFKNKTEQLLDF